MRSRELIRASMTTCLTPKGRAGALEPPQSPLGSHQPTLTRPADSEEPSGPARARRRPPGSTTTTPGPPPRSEELSEELLIRRRGPKTSSTNRRELATAPPWKRLTTSHPPQSSEDLRAALPTHPGAPKNTSARRRETAPRLLRDRCHGPPPLHLTPKDKTLRRKAHTTGPSRDPSSDT